MLEHTSSIVLILIGFIFILSGIIILKFPPKEINSMYGYRTLRSMKNQANWDFSQKLISKEFIKFGFIYCFIFGLFYIIDLNPKLEIIISLSLIIGGLIFMIYKTEKALKKFDDNENK